MAYEVYRVNRRFVWNGWQFAPKAFTQVATFETPANHLTAKQTAEAFKRQGCWDERSCNPALYAGDIWIVEENHPNKAMMLGRNKAVYDTTISGDPNALAELDEFKRFLTPPSAKMLAELADKEKKALAGVG